MLNMVTINDDMYYVNDETAMELREWLANKQTMELPYTTNGQRKENQNGNRSQRSNTGKQGL